MIKLIALRIFGNSDLHKSQLCQDGFIRQITWPKIKDFHYRVRDWFHQCQKTNLGFCGSTFKKGACHKCDLWIYKFKANLDGQVEIKDMSCEKMIQAMLIFMQILILL